MSVATVARISEIRHVHITRRRKLKRMEFWSDAGAYFS